MNEDFIFDINCFESKYVELSGIEKFYAENFFTEIHIIENSEAYTQESTMSFTYIPKYVKVLYTYEAEFEKLKTLCNLEIPSGVTKLTPEQFLEELKDFDSDLLKDYNEFKNSDYNRLTLDETARFTKVGNDIEIELYDDISYEELCENLIVFHFKAYRGYPRISS